MSLDNTIIVETQVQEVVSRSRTKANSPYSSIRNRVSIERNLKSNRDGKSKPMNHSRSNSIVNMKPVANLDSAGKPPYKIEEPQDGMGLINLT